MPFRIAKPQKQPMSPANLKSWLGSWQEWGSIILLFLTLEIVVRSLEQAQWITPQPSLTLVLALAVLTGWLLCQSRLPSTATYPLALVLGATVTLWQASNLLPSVETASRLNQLVVALQSWWQVTSMAEPSEGTIHFAVFLISFTWIMGYVSTWFILRRQNAWVAVLLGTTTILVNLSNLSEQHYVFFFFYVLAALLLVGQTSLARQAHWFKKHDAIYPNRGIIYSTASLLCLSILVVSVAWLTPETRVNRLETLISTKTSWEKNIEEYFANFFAAIPTKQPFLKSSDQRELFFGDSFGLGDQLQFVTMSREPSYWRARTHDIYTSSGWISSNVTEQVLRQGIPSAEAREFASSSEITYTVVPKLRTDIVLAAGEFISTNTPVSVWLLAPQNFDIELLQPHNPNIEVTRMQTGARDTVAVTTLRLLRTDQPYTVTTSISTATPADLSKAGDDYPARITDYFLQLPPTLPERVRQLSETVTKEVKSSYDQALAIKQYLSQFEYNLEVEAPPQGVDGVDYFLFSQKSGNCVQFASAMTVMLRSVGIPSRISRGYSPGEWDATTGRTILRAKQRHTWPEVYFPGYGWVEFEATPAIASEIEAISGTGNEVVDDLEEEMFEVGDEGIMDEDLDAGGVPTTPRNRLGPILPLAIILSILLLFTLRSPISRRLRRFTAPDNASGVYSKMCFLASLVKLKPKPPQTPLEYCSELTSVFPLQAEAFDNIAQAYIESRFSRRKELGLLEKKRLQKSWHAVYPALLKRLFHIRYYFPNR